MCSSDLFKIVLVSLSQNYCLGHFSTPHSTVKQGLVILFFLISLNLVNVLGNGFGRLAEQNTKERVPKLVGGWSRPFVDVGWFETLHRARNEGFSSSFAGKSRYSAPVYVFYTDQALLRMGCTIGEVPQRGQTKFTKMASE